MHNKHFLTKKYSKLTRMLNLMYYVVVVQSLYFDDLFTMRKTEKLQKYQSTSQSVLLFK